MQDKEVSMTTCQEGVGDKPHGELPTHQSELLELTRDPGCAVSIYFQRLEAEYKARLEALVLTLIEQGFSREDAEIAVALEAAVLAAPKQRMGELMGDYLLDRLREPSYAHSIFIEIKPA